MSKSEERHFDADSTVEIVSFEDVQFSDSSSRDDFDAQTDTRILDRGAEGHFASSAAVATEGDVRRQHERWALWLRAGIVLAQRLIIRAGATLRRLQPHRTRLVDTFRGLASRGHDRGRALVAFVARRTGSKVLKARLSANELARLRVVAAYREASVSTVVRTLVLQEYQRLAGRRQRRESPGV